MSAREATRAIGTAGRTALLVACSTAAIAAPTPRPIDGLRFDQVFNDLGEPPSLHYQVRYGAPGQLPHRLEVWRDGQRRLVRRTDDAIETHVARVPGEADFRMIVLDLRRKIETRIARDDLYRIGNFIDWFDLSHGLRHPREAYRLTASTAPAQAPRPLEVCDWYTLSQGGRGTSLCWSTRAHLPMLMLDAGGRVLWQVSAIERKAAPPAVFEVRNFGFVRNDASQDISND